MSTLTAAAGAAAALLGAAGEAEDAGEGVDAPESAGAVVDEDAGGVDPALGWACATTDPTASGRTKVVTRARRRMGDPLQLTR
jgi:hypothetical protein